MKYLSCIISFLLLFSISCSNSSNQNIEKKFSVGVFIPGVTSGNPTYEMLNNAALDIAKEYPNIEIKIIEAGYNQSQWEQKLTSFVAQKNFDIVITSNPAMPEICNNISKNFKNQKFIVTDSYYEGNSQIATYMFNQYEQSFILGYAAALISKSDMKNIVDTKKIGFIVSQEFPLLAKYIIPGYIEGAKSVDKDIELDYRVIGNWYDVNKALGLAESMIKNNVNVTAVIAGSSSVGVIEAFKDASKYIVFNDTDEYVKAPGTILLCGQLEQYKLVKQLIIEAFNNSSNIEYGKAKIIGMKDGYLDILTDSKYYSDYMPKDIQIKIEALVADIKNGNIIFEMNEL